MQHFSPKDRNETGSVFFFDDGREVVMTVTMKGGNLVDTDSIIKDDVY